jgi:outer membrane protein assembly factor BamB
MVCIESVMKINNRRYRAGFLLGLMMLLLTGCATLETAGELVTGVTSYFLGGIDNKEPPAELVEFEPEIEIDLLWKEHVGVGTEEQLLNLVLAISYGKVIVADREGLVQARDIKSGDLIWELETEYQFSSGPGVGSDTAILATSNAEVIALSIETGEKKWTTTVSSEVLANPLVAENTVILRTTDGKIIALSKEDGAKLWTFERSVPALSIRGTGSPVLIEDRVVAGYANGKLIELRLLDGKNIWETSIAIPSGRSEVERLVDLDVDPVETDGVIFISSYQGGTAGVLELDGDVLWRNEDVSSSSGLSYDWRYLYVSDTESKVWQLDQRNGASLWKQDELYNRSLTAPVAYDDYVVVGDYNGYIHWLASSDGRQLGRIKIADSAIDTRPVVVDNTVYVYTKDGTLAAIKARLF